MSKKYYLIGTIFLILSVSSLHGETDEQEAKQNEYSPGKLYLRLMAGAGFSQLSFSDDYRSDIRFSGTTYLLEGKLNGSISRSFHMHIGYSLHSTPKADSNLQVYEKNRYNYQFQAISYGFSFFFMRPYYVMLDVHSIIDLSIAGEIGGHNYRGSYKGNGYSISLGRDWNLAKELGMSVAIVYTTDIFLVRKDEYANVLPNYTFLGLAVGITYD